MPATTDHTGICKLCLGEVSNVGQLCKSHIIPRFILLKSKSKKTGRALSFKGSDKKFDLSQEDWKELMLCKNCEHLMKAWYEDFINETLFLRRKKPAIYDGPERALLSADSNHLALALLSIFWRAIVSKHPAFIWAAVPQYVTDELRTWIFTKHIPSTWHRLITIRVQELQDRNQRRISFLLSPFYRKQETIPQFDFVFICGGYCVTFSLPSLPDQIFSRTKTLRPNSRIVRIEKTGYELIPELNRMVQAMLETRLPDNIANSRDFNV